MKLLKFRIYPLMSPFLEIINRAQFQGILMPVKVLALVTINEHQPRALASYLKATGPLLEAVGAKIVQRFTVSEAVVGKKPAQSVMIVDYPNREAVGLVFGSQIYQDIIPIRDTAFIDYHVSVVADGDAATSENVLGN
ncbi:DUF1330 domain-containing protein [Roseobacter sp. EG26]|uniref:DUF1330 domain-containing protein n=1 Tax=Roseobacter sp. EG26 TaxID=3412477 RepID=UPI003CE5AD2F